MAQSMKNLLRITTNIFKNNNSKLLICGTRTLYSPSLLGVDGYETTRQNVKQQFQNMGDKFRDKMRLYIDEGPKNMIFTEDLKNMVHLVEDNSEDVELLSKMMIKFNSQNKELRFGSFIFGPVVMRAYYHLDRVDDAYEAFFNPQLEGFFDQLISYQILMDLLYNHKKYAELKKVFDYVSQRSNGEVMIPKNTVTLVLAGCYKENTPESFTYALNLWQKLKERGSVPVRKASTFFAGLALNQDRPDIAIEVISNVREVNYITIRNIKVLSLLVLNRLEDIIPILRISLANDSFSKFKQNYSKEVIDKLEEAIQKEGTDEQNILGHLIRQLKQNDQIVETTLDELISSDIVTHPQEKRFNRNMHYNSRTNFGNNSFRSNNYSNNYQSNRPRKSFNDIPQPGLKDLV